MAEQAQKLILSDIANKEKDYYCCPECKSVPIYDLPTNTFRCDNSHVFQINIKNHKEIFGKMMTQNPVDELCSKCKENKAIVYYLSEKEYICNKCILNHPNQNAKIELNKMNQYCKTHNQKYIIYCKDHNAHYCDLCDNIHLKCKSVFMLPLIRPDNNMLNQVSAKMTKIQSTFNNNIKILLQFINDYNDYYNYMFKIYKTLINTYKNNKNNYNFIYNVSQIINNNVDEKIKREYKLELIDFIDNLYVTDSNQIKMEIDVNDENINQNTYFLCDEENENEGEYSYDELNKDNCDLIVDNKPIQFQKHYKFNSAGKHIIKLVLKEELKTMENIFNNCKYITSIDLSYFNTSSINNLKGAFENCNELTEIKGLDKFTTENVTDMQSMFSNCKKLKKLVLTSFNTANVKNMKSMFQECNELAEIEGIDKFAYENVEEMQCMFNQCKKLKNLQFKNPKTNKVTNMEYMFQGCNELLAIGGIEDFNTENVENMRYMFNECYNLKSIDIRKFSFAKVKSIQNMFGYCYRLSSLSINGNINSACNNENIFMGLEDNKIEIKVKGGDSNSKITVFSKMYKQTIYY